MQKKRCLIVDDEPLARSLLRNHAEKMELLEIVGECDSALEALEFLRNATVDLIFLDIQMPQLTGLDMINVLDNKPAIIIVTAYREYAVEAFNLDVVDYLLKPVTLQRFIKAVHKYLRNLSEQNNPESDMQSGNASTAKSQPIEPFFIYLKDHKKVRKVPVGTIEYIEGLSEYIKVNTLDYTIIVKDSLLAILERLPSDNFIRIHKSYIINIDKIQAFTASSIDLLSVKELPIGRTFKNEVMTRVNYNGPLSAY